MPAAPYRESSPPEASKARGDRTPIVLTRIPVYLRLNTGFLLVVVGSLGWAPFALRAGDTKEFGFALSLAVGVVIANRVIEWFGAMDDDEKRSLRIGSIIVESTQLVLSLFGRRGRNVEPSAGPEGLLAGWWQCVRNDDAGSVKALSRGAAVWEPFFVPPRSDREIFFDASTWYISDGESWTDTCFVGVIDGEKLHFLPDGEATWRAALEQPDLEGLEDTRAATLGLLLAWLPPVERRAVLARCAEVKKVAVFTREDARHAEHRGRHIELPHGPTLKLTASERASWRRWMES